MSDLFPKVTNYYWNEDYPETKKEIRRDVLKYNIMFALVCFVYYLFYSFIEGNGLIFTHFFSIVCSIIMGLLGGYIIYVPIFLIRLIFRANRDVAFLCSAAGTKREYANVVLKYAPSYSFEYFSNKISSMMKILIFADRVEEIPFYKGAKKGELWPNAVDALFYGIKIEKCQKDKVCLYVSVIVHMNVLYLEKDKIKKKKQKFRKISGNPRFFKCRDESVTPCHM